jgi:type IV pilus assembly protein PilP
MKNVRGWWGVVGALAILVVTGCLDGRPGWAATGEAPGSEAPGAPVAEGPPKGDVPAYDAEGRRDPFQPQARPPGAPSSGEQRTPLQQFELSQLRLVAIVRDESTPAGTRAVVEDSAGLGYIMRIGTPVGRNDGRVTAIEPDRIVIEEWPVNVFGERRRTVIVKELDAGEEAKR